MYLQNCNIIGRFGILVIFVIQQTESSLKTGKIYQVAVFLTILSCAQRGYGQDTTAVKADTISKFEATNAKMERLFKIIPVPLYSYSTEAGHTFGLAKFNLIDLSKNDTISSASKISEVATFSTEGRINVSVATELNWHNGRYMVMGFINFKKQPEYMLGIGNDVSREDVEEVSTTRLKFVNYGLIQVVKNL
jgi:hypothetical protein